MSNQVPVFRVQEVAKRYWQGDLAINAIRNVSVTVNKGEFVVLAGPSGSGKTTLLNLIGGLDEPDSGVVWFADNNLCEIDESTRLALRRDHLGFIFQAFNLIPVLTAYENVEYGLWLTGSPREERKARVEKALSDVGLSERGMHRPDHLSGGERQRVALARALVHEPFAVLADEPTASLDTDTAKEIVDLFRQLSRTKGTTFVIATHDQSIISTAPRVIRLANGCVVDDMSGGVDK